MGASIKYPVPDYSMIPLVMSWFNLDMAIERKRLIHAWGIYIRIAWQPKKGK